MSKVKDFNLKTMVLTDSAVGLNIYDTITQFIADASKDDIVILYYAGHGLLDADYNYYLANYRTNFAEPKSGIPIAKLQETLELSESRKTMLILDACHSGAIDTEELAGLSETEQSTNETLVFRGESDFLNFSLSSSYHLMRSSLMSSTDESHTSVLASSSGDEYSIEGEKWQNGLYSHAFIKSMGDELSDYNNDGHLSLSEINRFVKQFVHLQSQGNQNPGARTESLYNDFQLW